ncbi:MAG: hypothetical protein Q9191_001196 [Dirinaria sp. TL-2023a]
MALHTTIAQYLTFQPGVTFDDPSTPHGKLWNSALKQVSQTQGWLALHWGTRVAAKDVADLLITWRSKTALQDFMEHGHQQFLRAISPLLCPGKDSAVFVPTPYLIDLHPGMPSLELGAISSLYELIFDAEPSNKHSVSLGTEIQHCRDFFYKAADELDSGDPFLGMDGSWIEPLQLASSPSTSSSSSGASDVTPGTKPNINTQKKTFLLILEWTDRDAMSKIFQSEIRRNPPLEGSTITLEDYFNREILQRSSSWSRHDVVLENVLGSSVAWLDKEEKWSDYVRDQLAKSKPKIAMLSSTDLS